MNFCGCCTFPGCIMKGEKQCFTLVLSTMMLPGSVTLIPQFLIWRNFHLVDTLWPLILPFFFGGGAFNIFLLRQFFLGIPRDLDDAARIDGAGAMQIFFRIMILLSKSAMVVVALFTFLNCWNDFFGPIIYLNSKEHFTIAIGLLQMEPADGGLHPVGGALYFCVSAGTEIPGGGHYADRFEGVARLRERRGI